MQPAALCPSPGAAELSQPNGWSRWSSHHMLTLTPEPARRISFLHVLPLQGRVRTMLPHERPPQDFQG